MSVPVSNDQARVASAAGVAAAPAPRRAVPWTGAGAAAVVVSGADLATHLAGGHLGMGSSLSAGAVAFFAVAGGGMALRGRGSAPAAWARRRPWQFAMLPAVAAAITVFVLSVLVGSSGVLGGGFTAAWHGALVYGLTGLAGTVAARRGPAARDQRRYRAR